MLPPPEGHLLPWPCFRPLPSAVVNSLPQPRRARPTHAGLCLRSRANRSSPCGGHTRSGVPSASRGRPGGAEAAGALPVPPRAPHGSPETRSGRHRPSRGLTQPGAGTGAEGEGAASATMAQPQSPRRPHVRAAGAAGTAEISDLAPLEAQSLQSTRVQGWLPLGARGDTAPAVPDSHRPLRPRQVTVAPVPGAGMCGLGVTFWPATPRACPRSRPRVPAVPAGGRSPSWRLTCPRLRPPPALLSFPGRLGGPPRL